MESSDLARQAFASAAQALAAISAHFGKRVSQARIEMALPSGADESEATNFHAMAGEAGLVGEALDQDISRLRGSHAPCLIGYVSAHGRKKWLAVSQIAGNGLAVCATPDGRSETINLNGVASQAGICIWSLAPLAGVEKTMSERAGTQTGLRAFIPGSDVLVPVVAATITVNILALAIPLATMNIFDRVISNSAFDTLWALAIGVALALGFDLTLKSMRTLLLDKASARSDVILSNHLFSRILGARMGARKAGIGIAANSLREFEGVREYLNAVTLSSLGDLPFVALFLLVIWLVAGNVVVVPLIAIPALFLAALATQGRLRKLVDGSFRDTAHKNSVAIEVLGGIETIKANRAERWAAQLWERAVASQLSHSLAIRWWTSLSINLVTTFQGLATISVLVYGVYLVTEGQITPGALFAANMLTARCLGPLAAIAALLSRLHQMRIAYASVRSLADMEQEHAPERELVVSGPIRQSLAFEGVTFGFNPQLPPVLSGVSMSIAVGERVGIIGGIGSGKSTLLNLILAMHEPASGRVLADGIPLTHLDPAEYRQNFGSVLQDPAFFQGTLRENVLLGRSDIGDLEIYKALEASGALAWVRRQPLGLDTPVGERGAGLSSGQRQTLALARAFAGDPAFLVLDEPSSDLDMASEAALVGRLKNLSGSTTLVLVTHRPALLEAVNRIVVLEGGRILLDGPREEVLQRLKGVVEERRQSTQTVSLQVSA